MDNPFSKRRFSGARLTFLYFSLLPALSPAITLAQANLPDAPIPRMNLAGPGEEDEIAELPQTAATPARGETPRQKKPTEPGFPPVSPQPVARPSDAPLQDPEVPAAPPTCLQGVSTDFRTRMSCERGLDPFQRFVDSAYVHPLTAKEKGYLAIRNTADPFNFATIAFISALSTASDPHSAYGPGFPGFGRNFGVAYAETATGAFFGTFLIPAIAHQDPHYHRLPNAPVARRIGHAITEVGWGVSDYGEGMPNYSLLLTTAIGGALADAYVPGIKGGFGPFAARYVTSVATAPIDNFITEFLPDVARRVNIRIVLVQRVINEVARQNGAAGAD